jgi:fatty-acid peroxygenase
MAIMPTDASLDSTVALLGDPYRFIPRRCNALRSDVFRTRLMMRRTICLSGRKAAELFYDTNRFIRKGAAPEPIRATLFGKGGIQGLDCEAHRHRKSMFMSLVTPERVSALGDLAAEQWRSHAIDWSRRSEIVLYDSLHPLLTSAVCAWAGVPLEPSEVRRRTRELTALFDSAGAKGFGHVWARLARRRAENWIAGVVERIRTGDLNVSEDSAAHRIATHREVSGALLPARIAAIEILNVLRPTVANGVFVVFGAHALHAHPQCVERIRSRERGYLDLFVQEVRRFYPFFPAVVARVRETFEWQGYEFRRGTRVMLDLYGTNHDGRVWQAPHEFRPERFATWNGDRYGFIPQGGGDHYANHRCPGEAITLELMKVSLEFLTGKLTYDVPRQDLEIDYGRLPALPQSRFIISNVRQRAS